MIFRRNSARFSCLAFIFGIAFLHCSDACGAAARDTLSPHYREWLDRDVPYIITKEEREAFLRLPNDEARDQFLERFWEIRNPTPGAPQNPYKEEHYRRIQHANQYFDNGSGEGWRTDRGRVYITLGEPQQQAKYLTNQNLRPLEIWFYSNLHGALPPFFYVVFFQREIGGDFRLYSPYSDGPEALITTLQEGNDRLHAFRVIDRSAGREVARTTLSLLPDEPVDIQNATSSLQSDILLSTIRNFANHPLMKEELNQRRQLLEAVSHRVILGGEFLHVLTVPLRSSDGTANLHYLLRLKRAEDFTLGRDGERYYYSVLVTVYVRTPEDKLIFTQERKLKGYVSATEYERVKTAAIGYQGLLALAPGKYKVEFLFADLLKQTAFREMREIAMPETAVNSLRITDLIAFTEAGGSTENAIKPFNLAGMKFTPTILDVTLGQSLNLFYQIWEPPANPAEQRGKTLSVEYVYGRLGDSQPPTVVKDRIAREQFDAAGSMVNGKMLDLSAAAVGNYRLAITVSDPSTGQKAYGILGFRVLNSQDSPRPWDIDDDQIGAETANGTADYQRALCYLAQGHEGPAKKLLQAALDKNPANEGIRARLVAIDFADHSFADVAALYKQGGITAQTDEVIILRMAESLEKLGDSGGAIALLQSALRLKPPTASLYLTLATYYRSAGDNQQAADLQRKGEALMKAKSSAN